MQHFELARIMQREREREIADTLRTRRFSAGRTAAARVGSAAGRRRIGRSLSRGAGVASAVRAAGRRPRGSRRARSARPSASRSR